jgi:hypothetical protein
VFVWVLGGYRLERPWIDRGAEREDVAKSQARGRVAPYLRAA